MQTPSRNTIATLCRMVQEAEFREDHHSIGNLLDYVRNGKNEFEQVEASLLWLMQDNQVTVSMYLGPAIQQLSTRAAEAALEEAKQQPVLPKQGG